MKPQYWPPATLQLVSAEHVPSMCEYEPPSGKTIPGVSSEIRGASRVAASSPVLTPTEPPLWQAEPVVSTTRQNAVKRRFSEGSRNLFDVITCSRTGRKDPPSAHLLYFTWPFTAAHSPPGTPRMHTPFAARRH